MQASPIRGKYERCISLHGGRARASRDGTATRRCPSTAESSGIRRPTACPSPGAGAGAGLNRFLDYAPPSPTCPGRARCPLPQMCGWSLLNGMLLRLMASFESKPCMLSRAQHACAKPTRLLTEALRFIYGHKERAGARGHGLWARVPLVSMRTGCRRDAADSSGPPGFLDTASSRASPVAPARW